MKKYFALCGLAISLSTVSYAQTEIRGIVSDSAGTPIPYVIVSIEGTYNSTVTDAAGAYTITVDAVSYCVNFQALGYEKTKRCAEGGNHIAGNVVMKSSVYLRDEVIVSSTRINNTGGVAYENVSKEQIAEQNFGQDLPYVLNNQTSVVTTSDAGNGIGYTGIRIRGSDPTRINVTINGVPVNDAESQGTYWVDLPDVVSSTENIQIQRGVGTSTNGAGAFGGSLNLQTELNRPDAYGEMILSGGSFNSWRATAKMGTGIIKDRWAFDLRMSRIGSDGFIDRGRSDLHSWYASGAYYGDKLTVKAITFSGRERTYQCWYGVPQDSIAVKNYTYNPAGVYYDSLGNELYYKNQVDAYGQDYYQLHFIFQPASRWTINWSLFGTRGKGYYEEYLQGQNLDEYGIAGSPGSEDLIRRRWLDNWYYGLIFGANYVSAKATSLTIGGAATTYSGKHYGQVIWATGLPAGYDPERHYYDDDALKDDINVFVKVTQPVGTHLTIYADMQFRMVNYYFTGLDLTGTPMDQNVSHPFFNPKVGVNYTINANHTAYVYFGIGNKEPGRIDYTGSTVNSRPKPETLYDAEGGWKFSGNKLAAEVNLYYMYYKNQLVLTGKVNDVGAYTRENVDVSYRRGVEISLGYNITSKLNFTGNVALSQNKIERFDEYIDDYDNGGQLHNTFNNVDISFSPSVISAGILSWKDPKGYSFSLTGKYVGAQFLDNTMNGDRMIDEYFLLNFGASWSPIRPGTKENQRLAGLSFGLQVNNLLNKMYSSNGYTYGYVWGGMNRYNYYYPQAGINVMGMVTFKFQ